MSSAFGIAAVTALLRDLLNRRLTDAKAGGIVNANASVSAQPPDRVPVDNGAESRLNLFLYEVSPNTGYANEDLASRDSDGRAVSNPVLALNLQYLLSAYGVDDMEAEILLGHAMQAFHETPGLSRIAIRKLLDPGPPDNAGVLPKKFRQRAVTLADQVEVIKISPHFLNSDEMSKIWTSLQAHYRLSVAYKATVVLIDSNKAVRAAPPVLMRGTEDRGPRVQASLLPPFPTLLAVRLPPDRQLAVRMDDKIELFGHHLEGSNVVVHFANPRLGIELTASGLALVITEPALKPEDFDENETLRLADTSIVVDLSKAVPANAWAAGNYSVEVEVIRPGEASARLSNTLGFAVAPSFAVAGADKPVVVKSAGNVVKITLTCSPKIQPSQVTSLVIGDQELPGPAITAAVAKTAFEGTLPAAMLVPGTQQHLARLRVDGVDSLYIKRNPKPKPPEFDPAQRITMPP